MNKEPLSLRINHELKEKLRSYSEDYGKKMNNLVEELLEEHFAEMEFKDLMKQGGIAASMFVDRENHLPYVEWMTYAEKLKLLKSLIKEEKEHGASWLGDM